MTTIVDFIGRGIAFPMRADPKGGIALAGGTDDIDQSIYIILSTAPGERVMRPDFGCEIWDMVFAPMDEATWGEMDRAVRNAVLQWEPRVDLEDVAVERDAIEAGRINIEITYRVKSMNERRNLVYPFYIIPEEQTV